jgi:hypothetical protein
MASRDPAELLTVGQHDALRVIDELWNLQHRPPSFAELAKELGLKSRSGAYRLVQILRAKGALRPLPGGRISRPVFPVSMPADMQDIPEIKRVALEAICALDRLMPGGAYPRILATALLKALGGDHGKSESLPG